MLVITFSMVISLILVFGWIIALNRISWSSLFLCFRIMSICRLHILLLWLLLSILLLLVLFSGLSILFLLLKFEHSCDLNIFDLPLLIVIIIHDMIQFNIWIKKTSRTSFQCDKPIVRGYFSKNKKIMSVSGLQINF